MHSLQVTVHIALYFFTHEFLVQDSMISASMSDDSLRKRFVHDVLKFRKFFLSTSDELFVMMRVKIDETLQISESITIHEDFDRTAESASHDRRKIQCHQKSMCHCVL